MIYLFVIQLSSNCRKFPTSDDIIEIAYQSKSLVCCSTTKTMKRIKRPPPRTGSSGKLVENFFNLFSHRREITIVLIFRRAFNKGHLGEVYICYEDNTPQNLVEIAFRLAMST